MTGEGSVTGPRQTENRMTGANSVVIAVGTPVVSVLKKARPSG